MSDVGLRADVDLDIRAALAQVDRLEEALTRATTDVRVTADARSVTAAIDAAIANADTDVLIAADARDVAASITAAVEDADTAVVVTGDARELTGDVTAAVDAADTHVTVTGDVDPRVRAQVDDLDDSLGNAAATAGLLKASLAALSVGAAIRGIAELGQAASDLAESTSKASVVFGDSFEDIAVFAEGAATAVGLSEQAALEAAATFGNLFQSLGATQEVAADLSPKIVQLAADLASFNNLGVDETLEKLRSGLVGEIEPLRSLGVSFTAAEVEAKAFELGLARVGEEVSEGAKLQARYQLIMEQTTLAQGDFARTSEGLANQQRILRAEFQQALATIGEGLLPVFLDLIRTAREQLIPAFTEFATEVLPPLLSILTDLAPLLASTATLLVSLAPVLTTLAGVIDSIPAPLLGAVAGFLALSRAVGGFQLRGQEGVTMVQRLATGIGRFGFVLAPAAVGLAGLADAAAKAAERKRLLQKITQDMTAALIDEAGALQITNTGLAKFVESNADGALVLGVLGGSVEDLGRLIQSGTGGLEEFRRLLDEQVSGGGLGDELLRGLLSDAMEDLQASLEQVAAAQIIAAQASGAVSEAEAQQALTSGDLIGAYESMRGQIEEHNAALDALEAKYAPQIAAAERLGSAYLTLQGSQDEVISGLSGLADGLGDPDQELTDFILLLDRAGLSEQEMGAAAALMGADVATLAAIIDATAAELDDFVNTAVGGLPTIGDAFKPAETGARRTAGATRDVAKETRDMERAIRDAERGIVQANRGVEDSLESLNDAYANVEDAIEGVTEAQERLAEAEEALARARQGPTPRDLEEAEIGVQEARISAERASLRIQQAEERLNEARREGDPEDVRQAELDLESARLSARASLFDIQDAELALQETREKGSEQDQAVIDAQDRVEEAYDGVTEAQDRVVEANRAVVDAQLAVEEATYRVVTAQEALIDAQERTISSGGGGGAAAVEEQRVTIQQFLQNLRTQREATVQFLADLDTIARAGGSDLAATLAEQGVEIGGSFARELAASVKGGVSGLVTAAEGEIDATNDVLDDAEDFFRNDFGPRYIAASKLVAELAAKGFGSKLTVGEQTRIAMRLANTELDKEGRAIALIAATSGEKAAKDYAAKFKINDDVLAEGLAVARTLNDDKPGITTAAANLGTKAAVSGWGRTWKLEMDNETSGGIRATRISIDNAAGDLEGAADRTGSRASGGFGRGFGGVSGEAEAGLGGAADTISRAATSGGFLEIQAFISGGLVGAAFVEGLTLGIKNNSDGENDPLIQATREMIRDIERAARHQARSTSPSKVFADLGHDLISGLALGIEDSATEAEAAATDAITSVTAAIEKEIAQLTSDAIVLPDVTAGQATVNATVAQTAAVSQLAQQTVNAQNAIAAGLVVPGAIATTGGGFGTQINVDLDLQFLGAIPSPVEARSVAETIEDTLITRLRAEREFAVAWRAEGQ